MFSHTYFFRHSNNSKSSSCSKVLGRQRKLGTVQLPTPTQGTCGSQEYLTQQSSPTASGAISTTGSLISRLVREFSGSAAGRLARSASSVSTLKKGVPIETLETENSFGEEAIDNSFDKTECEESEAETVEDHHAAGQEEKKEAETEVRQEHEERNRNKELVKIVDEDIEKDNFLLKKQISTTVLPEKSAEEIVKPIVEDIICKSIEYSSSKTMAAMSTTTNATVSMTTMTTSTVLPLGGSCGHPLTTIDLISNETSVSDCGSSSGARNKTNIRFVRKSLENSILSVQYSKSNYYETDTIETECPRNLDDNIEILSREAEDLEGQFTASEDNLQIGPIFDIEKFEAQRKQQKVDDEDEPIGQSPCGRFFKYNKEVGRGSFKTVFRGLDTQTGVAVAWCELLVCF